MDKKAHLERVVPLPKRRCRLALTDLALLAGLFCICHSPFISRVYTPVPITTVGVVPGGTVGSQQTINYLGADFGGTIAELSDAEFARQAIAGGEWPFWHPYKSAGAPQIGEPAMLALFYPLNWLRFLLPPRDWDVVPMLGVFLAGVFIWTLAREWGQGRAAALFSGAAVYALGTTQLYLAVPSVANTVAWVPGLWWIAARLLRRRAVGWLWLAAVVVTYCLMTAGSITPALLGGVTVALYVVLRCLADPALWRVAFAIAPAFLCGLALAAPQVLTFLDYASNSGIRLGMRGNVYTYGPQVLPSVLIPYLFGAVHAQVRFAVAELSVGYFVALGWLTPLATLTSASGIVRSITQRRVDMLCFLMVPGLLVLLATDPYPLSLLTKIYPLNRVSNQYTPWMAEIALCAYAGVGLEALVTAPRHRIRQALWFLTAVITVCTAASIVPLLQQPWSVITANPTLKALGGGVGVAAGWVAVAWLIFRPEVSGSAVRCTALVFAALLVAAISSFPYGFDGDVMLAFRAGSVLSAILVLLALWFARTPEGGIFVAATGLVTIAVVTCNLLAPLGLPQRRDPFAAVPFVDFLKPRTVDHRAFGLDGFLFPNTAAVFGISSLNALTPMMPDWAHEMVARLSGSRWPAYSWGLGLGGDPWETLGQYPRFYDYLAVRYVVVPPRRIVQLNTQSNLQPVFTDPLTKAVVLERQSAQPRAYVAAVYAQAATWRDAGDRFMAQNNLRDSAFGEEGAPSCATGTGGGTARILRLTPNTVVIEAQTISAGTLVLVDAFMSGWSAELNGAPVQIQRVNGAFRGLCIDVAGVHRIEMRYEPPLWRTGCAVMLGAMAVLTCAFLCCLVRSHQAALGARG